MAAVARTRASFAHCYIYGIYGLSMGGDAAIHLSGAVAAKMAITIASQFTINPRAPPFDAR